MFDQKNTTFTKRFITLNVSTFFVFQPIFAADIILDTRGHNAGHTTLDTARNGVPVVNIARPSSSGVSHNHYINFNVPTKGTILNNSGKEISTQLSGYIYGNENVKNSSASLILNEVTGNNRSQLKGYMEVAGPSADVIIANPNGITVNGAGFMNIPKATLTTGKVSVSGNRRRFDISGGDIKIDGNGIDSSSTDLDIYAQSIKLNADIHAKKLKLVFGKNTIDSRGKVTAKAANTGGYGLDSSTLGGIYANAITLIGTQKGVGVNLPGEMLLQNSLSITTDGKISLGKALAKGDMALKSKSDDITIDKGAHAKNLSLDAKGIVTLNANTGASNNVDIKASNLVNEDLLAAGVNDDFSEAVSGKLTLNISQKVTNHSTLFAKDSISVNSHDFINTKDASVTTDTLSINSENHLENKGTITAGITTLTSNIITNTGLIHANDDLTVNAKNLDSSDAVIESLGKINLNVSGVVNVDRGTLYAEGKTDISAASISANEGEIILQDDAVIEVTDTLEIDDGYIEANSLDVDAKAFNANNAQIHALGELVLSTQTVQADTSTIQAVGDITIHSDISFQQNDNALLYSEGNIEIQTQTLGHADSASFISLGDTTIDTNILDNTDSSIVAKNLTIISEEIDNENAELLASGYLDIRTETLDNTDGVIQANTNVNVEASGDVDNTRGVLYSVEDISIDASEFNNEDGLLGSNKKVSLTAVNLRGDRGIFSGDGIAVTTEAISSDEAVFESIDGLVITASGDVSLTSATLLANNQINLKAHDTTLDGSTLYSVDDGISLTTNRLQAREVYMEANGILSATAFNDMDISGSTLRANDIDLNSQGDITADSTNVIAANDLDITADSLRHSNGQLISDGYVNIMIKDMLNQEHNSSILSYGSTSIGANNYNVTGASTLYSQDALKININQTFNHLDNSRILTNDTAEVSAKTYTQNTAMLYTANGATFDMETFNSSDASILGGSTEIHTRDFNNANGNFSSDSSVKIMATESIANENGVMSVNGDLVLEANEMIANNGEFESGGTLKVTSQRLQVNGTRFFGTESLDISTSVGTIDAGSKLLSLDAMKLDFAGNVINHGEITANGMYVGENDIDIDGSLSNYGSINSGYTLGLDAKSITNYGKIQGGGFTVVNLSGTLDNRGFFTSSYDLEVIASTITNSAGIAAANDMIIGATNLTNTHTMYSARDMNLNISNTLSNSKDIYAGEDLHITANTLSNYKGSIESYRDMYLSASHISNIGSASISYETNYLNLITGEIMTQVEVDAWILLREGYEKFGDEKFNGVNNRLTEYGLLDKVIESYGSAPHREGSSGFGDDDEEHMALPWVEFKTSVEAEASVRPATMISGNNLTMNTGSFTNTDSIISSARNMTINAGSVQNVPTSVTVDIESIVNNVSWEFIDNSWSTNDDTAMTISYSAPVVTEQKIIESASQILVGGTFSGNIGNFENGAGSSLVTAAPVGIDTSADATADSQNDIGGVDNVISQGNIEDRSHSATTTAQTHTTLVTKLDIPVKIYNPNTAKVELPNNPYGIFVTNPKPIGPLIEFNPEYTNYNNYVSSDYLLDRLGYDGTEQTRRLGDAMHETQLVRNSIMAMTGQRYVGDATNDAELYINLLDGGVKFAKEVGLVLGVAPTTAQLTRISEDLVWLVNKNVGGHTVLAPVVYLAHAYEGAKGGYIDAESINLNISGHLANAGNINTRSDMILKVNTLTNTGGNIEAGRNMHIAAVGDIKNLSGSIRGGSVVLKSAKGNIVNETLTSGIEFSNSFGKRHYTSIGKIASLEATNGPLLLDAGGNIENIGADLRSAGSIGLSAGENVEVTTLKDKRSYDYAMPHGTTSGESVTHIQSNISAGDGLSISSGKDTHFEAVKIKASNTYVSAKGKVDLSAVVESDLKQSHVEEDGVFSSSSTTDMRLKESVKGTEIETGTLVIQGKEGVELESAMLNTANAVQISSSQGDVTLTAKSYTNASSHEETNSILGGLYESRELDAVSETLLADSSTSAQNSIIVAGENVNIIATDLSAKGGVKLSASQNVNIMSGIEEKSETHINEKKGITLKYNDGRITFNEKNKDTTTQTSYTNKASNVYAKTLILESGADTNIIASNVVAETMLVNADRDFNELSAKDITTMHTEHTKEETGIEFTLNSRESSVFAGYWEEQNGEHTSQSKVASSNISVGTLAVNAKNTNVIGSNITGNDIAIHSDNIRILSDSAETNTDAYTYYLRVGVEVAARQNLSNVFDTANGLKDVKSGTAAVAGALQTYDALQGYAEKPVTYGVNLIHEEMKTNTHIKNADVVASSISATNALTLNAKNELEIAGSDVSSANALNIYADTINIHASESTYSTKTDSETKNVNVGLYSTDFGQVTVAYQENEMETTGTVQRNSKLYAGGTATIISRGDTTLLGANIDAKDLRLSVGGDLHMESLQDTQSIVGSSRGGSVTGGFGGITGVSVNAGETSGEKAWVSQVTGINGRESTRVNVGGTTTLTGASITNIDENGIDQGNLVLSTKHLVLNDIIDIDTLDDTTVGIGSSNGEGRDPSLTSATYANNSKDKEQITRATIGKGTINTGSMTGTLNRDISKIQEITKDEASNTEFYVSDKSLAFVKDPGAEISSLGKKLEDVGSAAHAEMMNNLPSESKGNDGEGDFIDKTIGKALDVFGEQVPLGILPSVENAGGYVSQLAIHLFGDNRTGLSVKKRETLIRAGVEEKDIQEVVLLKTDNGIKRTDELKNKDVVLGYVTVYRTNSNKSVRIDEVREFDENGNDMDPLSGNKIHLSSEDIQNSGIGHLFTNGMFNDHDTAIYNQQTQQGFADAVLNYNQQHGVIGDLLESVQDSIAVNTGISSIGTGGARQTGNLINQLSIIRKGDLTASAHSQGTLMTQVGMLQHQKSLGDLLQDNIKSDFLVQYSGSPVNHLLAENLIRDIYGGDKGIESRYGEGNKEINNVFRSHIIPEDAVGSVLGYQSAGINNSDNLKENMTKSVIALPRLFGFGDASPHSYYPCIIGCGDKNYTPDIKNIYNQNDLSNENSRNQYYIDNFTNKEGKVTIDINLLPISRALNIKNGIKRTIIDTTERGQ